MKFFRDEMKPRVNAVESEIREPDPDAKHQDKSESEIDARGYAWRHSQLRRPN